MGVAIIVLVAWILGLAYFTYTKIQQVNKLDETVKRLMDKYGQVINVDEEVEKRKAEIGNLDKDIFSLKESYKSKKEIFDGLEKELALVEGSLDMTSFGVYTPHFDFTDSEAFKNEILKVVEEQKNSIKNDTAMHYSTNWTVNGSKAEGKKMTNRNMKLMMRAFNGECDAAIGKAKWNNVLVMEERIRHSFEAINKSGEVNQISISPSYLELKIKELRLTHEKEEKIHKEKEEQKEIREQMREEEKVRLEIEKKLEEVEKEQARYQKALEQARHDVEKSEGAKKEALEQKIAELEGKLHEANAEKERAKSRAEMTKSGHVYVVSNIGSFGENVFKIGMTRRLDPQDRVDELGNAAVPFLFDVHAMIYSDDVPKMEHELHRAFEEKRLNLVNSRKEFFGISLEEVEAKVHELKGDIQFTKIAEAQEYRKTMAIKEQKKNVSTVKETKEEKFPAELYR